MRKMRWILCLCVAALICGCFTGCESPDTEGRQTITFWHSWGGSVEKSGLEAMVKAYNDSQSTYYVKAQYIADMESKMQTAIKGNNAPDVVAFDRFQVISWASEGLLLDLTTMAQEASVTKDVFYEYTWDESVLDGKLYSIPFTCDDRMLVWNKDMFAAAGLDPETPPKTVAELDEMADKLTSQKDGRYDTMGFVPWTGAGGVVTFGFAFGGEFYNAETGEITASDPAVVRALEWMVGYADRYGIDAMDSFSMATSSDIDAFAAQKQAISIAGSWSVAQYATVEGLNYGVAPIPNETGDNFTTWGGGYGMIIPFNADAENVEGAFDFIKFCTMGDGSTIFGEQGGWFVCNIERNTAIDWEKDPHMKPFLDALTTGKSRPQIAVNEYYMNQLNSALDKALHKKGTPQELLDEVVKRVNYRQEQD